MKPVILIGQGARHMTELLNLDIPVLTTWMAIDIMPEDHPAFCGRPGIFGQRAANIIQQEATHLYVYGARLDGEQVAYDYDRFAPNAEIFVHDIDEAEYSKFPPRYQRGALEMVAPEAGWLEHCKALYRKYRPELDGTQKSDKYVDPFTLMRLLHDFTDNDDVFALGSSGGAPCTFLQAYKVKEGQLIRNVSTIGAMGADIPMALGAALATGRRTICLTGDGGFQMNAQELETISRLHLPVIFFVLNNNGYNSIRVMQDVRYKGNRVGCDPASGLTFPYLEELAHTYGLMSLKLDANNLQDFDRCFVATPLVVEVMVDPEWVQLPRVMASKVNGQLRTDDMEDMTPKL